MIEPQIVDVINWKCVCAEQKARRKKVNWPVVVLLYILIQNRKTMCKQLSECSCQKLDKIEYFCSINNYFSKSEEMQFSKNHNGSEWALRFWVGFIISKLKNLYAAPECHHTTPFLALLYIIKAIVFLFWGVYALWHFYMIALSRLFSTLIDNLVYKSILLVLRGL